MRAVAILMVAVASTTILAGQFETTVTVHAESPLGRISPNIYGQYLEHVEAHEETIYPSLWDSKHPASDATGVRIDVTSEVAKLGVPIVRWPGGCFADVYHWEDAIGPQADREPKPNLHWKDMESNKFGTDEFLHWCELTGVEPYINVNLGSGTLDEALRWLEYCNGDISTPQGQRRAANGREKPWGVKYWGIGNETWGPWETGHTDAGTYGTSLSLWARAMKAQDPTIQVLGVGSEEGNEVAWDSTVLEKAGADIDYLTVHMYGVNTKYDGSEYYDVVYTPDYLATRLEKMIGTLDQVTSDVRRVRLIQISVDEWNIRHFFDGKQSRKDPRSLQDAIFTAGFFHAMIGNCDRVTMANYVFLVNGNGTLLVDDDQVVWTPMAHVFHQYQKWMKGTALQTESEGPGYLLEHPLTGHPGRKAPGDYIPEEHTYVSAASALQDNGALSVALVNRHKDDAARVKLNLPEGYSVAKAWTLAHTDIYARNTFDEPGKVVPQTTVEDAGKREWLCPAHSVTLLLCKRDSSK